MKTRSALIVILVILVAVFLLIRFGGRRGGEEPLFPDLKRDEVARIVIASPDTTVVLVKADEVWFVTSEDSLPAEVRAVDDILNNALGFSRKDIISSNPEKRALYQVDSTGVFVTLDDAAGNMLVEFVVGKRGPDYQSTYVRDVESGDVVLAPGYLPPVFDRGKRTWQDRTVYALEPDTITEIAIRRPGETLALGRDKAGEWYISEPESAACDPDRMTRLVRTLAYLRCDELAGRMPVPASGLAEPDSSIGFGTADGLREELLFGNRNEEDRTFAKRADSEIVYLLSTYKVDAMLPRLEELRAVETEAGEAMEGEKGQ